ncbi:hypothetical protein ACWIUD_03375 [Helicobacter sp. 23-1044]
MAIQRFCESQNLFYLKYFEIFRLFQSLNMTKLNVRFCGFIVIAMVFVMRICSAPSLRGESQILREIIVIARQFERSENNEAIYFSES